MFDPSFDRAKLDGLTRGLGKQFVRRFHRLPFAMRRLMRAQAQVGRTFEDYDVLLSPVLGTTTPEIGHLSPALEFDVLLDRLLGYVSFTPLANVTGGPAIALPWSRTARGIPVGIQLFGGYGDERTLLELSYAIEEAHPWPTLASS